MRQKEVLRILNSQLNRLTREFKVKSLSVFGSVARDEATDKSDIDLLVVFERPTGYFGVIGLQQYLETLFSHPVDVVTPGGLKASMKPFVEKEAIHVI